MPDLAQLPSNIYGMHDPGGEHLFLGAARSGWIVISVRVSPPDASNDFSSFANQGFGVIVRLNNGYGPQGTIPPEAQYDGFANACSAFVNGSQGCKIWIIGNETNLPGERPGNVGGSGGEVITPARYASCFSKCRAAIRGLPGHRDDWIVPAAPGPWNNQTQYPSNPSGDWVLYFRDILNECVARGQKPDALALHTYTHGHSTALITSEQKMGPPFQGRRYQFRTYRDFLSVVPSDLRSAPAFITETQPVEPGWSDQNVGWIQAAYAEVNAWNASPANQPIQALCLFRWQHNPTDPSGWSVSNRPNLHTDFSAALASNYRLRWDPAAAATAAAQSRPWMPINPAAALHSFAASRGLGCPQTDEFQFSADGALYVGQVFQGAIVYVKHGDWANVKTVGKP